MGLIQSGVASIGSSGSVSKRVTVIFDTEFPAKMGEPEVVANTLQNWTNLNIPDTFVASIVSVSNTQFVAQVRRVDANNGWGQDLRLGWIAYSQMCEIRA